MEGCSPVIHSGLFFYAAGVSGEAVLREVEIMIVGIHADGGALHTCCLFLVYSGKSYDNLVAWLRPAVLLKRTIDG